MCFSIYPNEIYPEGGYFSPGDSRVIWTPTIPGQMILSKAGKEFIEGIKFRGVLYPSPHDLALAPVLIARIVQPFLVKRNLHLSSSGIRTFPAHLQSCNDTISGLQVMTLTFNLSTLGWVFNS